MGLGGRMMGEGDRGIELGVPGTGLSRWGMNGAKGMAGLGEWMSGRGE